MDSKSNSQDSLNKAKLLRCDNKFPCSNEGLTKIPQMALSLLSFVCVQSSTWCYDITFYCSTTVSITVYQLFLVTTMYCFLTTLLFYAIRFARLHEKISFCNWNLTTMINNCLDAFALTVITCFLAGNTAQQAGVTAGALLGFLTAAVFAVDAYMAFNRYQRQTQKKMDRAESQQDTNDGGMMFSGDLVCESFPVDQDEPMLHVLKKRSSSQESFHKLEIKESNSNASKFESVSLSSGSSTDSDESKSIPSDGECEDAYKEQYDFQLDS